MSEQVINLNGEIPRELAEKALNNSVPGGILFNFDIELTPGEEGIIEGTIKARPGDGDRGPNLDWVDISNAGGRYYLHLNDEEDQG